MLVLETTVSIIVHVTLTATISWCFEMLLKKYHYYWSIFQPS